MKKKRRLTTLILLCVSVLILAGCSSSTNDTIIKKGTITGTVIDSASDEPLAEAVVTVGTESVMTGTNGKFFLELVAGSYDISIQKAGYDSLTDTVTIFAGEETVFDSALVRAVSTGLLSGRVVDCYTGDPIAEAVVTVGTESVTTGTEGSFTFTLPVGSYDIVVEKNDYEIFNGTAIVEEDQVTDLSVGLFDAIAGTVSGIVTDGRGGPVVEGVTISVKDSDISTTTDANGEFSLSLKANYQIELLVEAENRATMRIQSVQVAQDEEFFVEIPTRDIFNPNWSSEPPTISLNIQPGQELTGNQEIEVTVTGERDTYLIYAYLGADHRNPRTLFKSDTDFAAVTVDTTAFPNGESFLKVLVYDDNENGALYIIPVSINNTADDTVVPDDLSSLYVSSFTYGQNIGFYSKKINDRLEQKNMSLDVENIINAAPDGASLNINLSWEPVANADGYAIYRAFGEEQSGGLVFDDYTLFSRVPSSQTSVDDFSTQITANVPMMYKVVPYNSYGEGAGMERSIKPLPAYNVYLETPADQATDVALNPTFTWKNEVAGGVFAEGLEFYSDITIFDGTNSLIWIDSINDDNSYILRGITLDPNGIYSWDISYSEVLSIYEYDEFGYSYALSVAGEYGGTGSINGEYIFTTTTDVQ